MGNILNIIWDWNGTLLDDLEISVSAFNQMLDKRGMDPITEERYKEVFTFPIQDYYKSIGLNFEKESFAEISDEFLKNYFDNFRRSQLHSGVVDAIRFFKKEGIMQYILSAMEKTDLMNTLYTKGINHYFKGIYGINDKFARGKLEAGKKLMEKERLSPENTLIIGDTLHDYEVASHLGCQVALIARGHSTLKRLQSCGAQVFDDIHSIVKRFDELYSFR